MFLSKNEFLHFMNYIHADAHCLFLVHATYEEDPEWDLKASQATQEARERGKPVFGLTENPETELWYPPGHEEPIHLLPDNQFRDLSHCIQYASEHCGVAPEELISEVGGMYYGQCARAFASSAFRTVQGVPVDLDVPRSPLQGRIAYVNRDLCVE